MRITIEHGNAVGVVENAERYLEPMAWQYLAGVLAAMMRRMLRAVREKEA